MTEKPPVKPQEFGFVSHEAGPEFMPSNHDLLPAFHDKITSPIPTQLLETDHGNKLLLGSLIGFHPKLTEIADRIESKGGHEPVFSSEIQGHVLKILKRVADEHGRGVKTVTGLKNTIYYDGSKGVNNGRLVRVYITKIGQSGHLPVYGKIAACRTKEDERRVYRTLGLDGAVNI